MGSAIDKDWPRLLATWATGMVGSRSPLYRALGLAAAAEPVVLALIAELGRSRTEEEAILGFFAAVHAFLARTPTHPLARWYPTLWGIAPPDEDPWPVFQDLCRDHGQELVAIARPRSVQTNEARRSAILLPALHRVAERTRQPLAMVEVGCSVGLNLRLDRYGYRYRDLATGTVVEAGDPSNSVVIECDLVGGRPALPHDRVDIGYRVGLDRVRLDAGSTADAAWLLALVWPEQVDRHRRLAAALDAAADDPPPVIEGDAIDVLPEVVAAVPPDVALCIVHTHVMYQLSVADQRRFTELLAHLGRARPIDRVSVEWIGTPQPVVGVTHIGPDGTWAETLGAADQFGAWLDWTATPGR